MLLVLFLCDQIGFSWWELMDESCFGINRGCVELEELVI